MASLLPQIPLEFMHPAQKWALMNWLVNLALPAHISRGILQAWGEEMGVQIDASDYALLNDHRLTVRHVSE